MAINIYHKAEVDKTTIDVNESSKLHTVHPYYKAVAIKIPASTFDSLDGNPPDVTFEVPQVYWDKVCRYSISQRNGKWSSAGDDFMKVGKHREIVLQIKPTNQESSTGDDLYVLIEVLPEMTAETVQYELHTENGDSPITLIRPVGSTALIDYWAAQ